MKRLFLLLFTSTIFAQNPVAVPTGTINSNPLNFKNNAGIYNSTLTNVSPQSLTQVEIDAITTPKKGRMVYNSTTGKLNVFSDVTSSWEEIGGAPSNVTILYKTYGITSRTLQQVITSADGALSVRAESGTNGQLQVLSNVGGTWSASWVGALASWYNTGGGGGNITLQSANIGTWSTAVGGSWTQRGGSQILHIRNETTNKLYRVTRFISNSYTNCPVIIEILN